MGVGGDAIAWVSCAMHTCKCAARKLSELQWSVPSKSSKVCRQSAVALFRYCMPCRRRLCESMRHYGVSCARGATTDRPRLHLPSHTGPDCLQHELLVSHLRGCCSAALEGGNETAAGRLMLACGPVRCIHIGTSAAVSIACRQAVAHACNTHSKWCCWRLLCCW